MTGPAALPSLVTAGAPIFCAVPVALLFLLLATAVGRRLLKLLGATSSNEPLESAVVAFALGAGVLQFAPFVLGTVGVLSVRSLQLVLLLLLALFARDMVGIVRRGPGVLASRAKGPRWLLAWSLALVPGLGSAFLCALTPTTDPDGLGYHLTVPKRWLATHSLSYLPTYTNSNMPMGVEMLFTSAMVFGGDAAAKVVHLLLGSVGALGLFLAGKRVGGPALAALAVAAYLVGPFGVSFWLGQAMVEGATCLAAIGATLAWLIWLQGRESGWLRVAFLLAGVAVSFKITAGLLPVTLLALTWVAWSSDGTVRFTDWRRMPVFSLVALAALPALPWLVRAAIVTGNPLYPLAVGLIPSRDFTPDLAEQWGRFNRYWSWAIRFGASWSFTRRQQILVVCSLSIAVAGAFLSMARRDARGRGVSLVLTAVVLVQLLQIGLYLRYWVPLMAILTLGLLWLVRDALAHPRAKVAIVIATAVFSLRQAQRNLTLEGNDLSQIVPTAFGFKSQHNFLAHELELLPLYQQANRELPLDSGIFLVSYCSGFLIDRSTFCGDVVQGSIRIGNWTEFAEDLGALHVTHLLAPLALAAGTAVQTPAEAVSGGVGIMAAARTNVLVGQLLQEHGVFLGSAADTGLYRIDWNAHRVGTMVAADSMDL